MTVVIAAASVCLLATAAAAMTRLVVGPSMADRVVAADVLLVAVAGGLAMEVVAHGSSDAIVPLVYVTLLSFTGTVIAGRFVESREESP